MSLTHHHQAEVAEPSSRPSVLHDRLTEEQVRAIIVSERVSTSRYKTVETASFKVQSEFNASTTNRRQRLNAERLLMSWINGSDRMSHESAVCLKNIFQDVLDTIPQLQQVVSAVINEAESTQLETNHPYSGPGNSGGFSSDSSSIESSDNENDERHISVSHHEVVVDSESDERPMMPIDDRLIPHFLMNEGSTAYFEGSGEMLGSDLTFGQCLQHFVATAKIPLLQVSTFLKMLKTYKPLCNDFRDLPTTGKSLMKTNFLDNFHAKIYSIWGFKKQKKKVGRARRNDPPVVLKKVVVGKYVHFGIAEGISGESVGSWKFEIPY